MVAISITVNGDLYSTDVEADTPLLYVLQERSQIERTEIRLWPRAVWGLHSASGWQTDSLLCNSDVGSQRA